MKAYINAKIHTMDESNSEADYLLIQDGKILEAGNNIEKSGYFSKLSNENIIDLDGKVVVPGFWESHIHIVDGIRTLMELNLRSMNSLQQLKARLEEYSKGIGEDDWIIGHGWDESRLFGGSFPDKGLLDSLHKEHPVMLVRMDGHSLCLNSKGIELMKVEEMVESSEVPFEEDREPTGMLFENAANKVSQRISESFSDSYLEKLILKAQEAYLENGITSINDICTKYGKLFDMYRRLQKEGKLKIRIVSAPYGEDPVSMEEFDLRKGDETESLTIGAPKYFMDGSFGSRTALLFEDYADAPGKNGLQLIKEEELKRILIENESINQPITIHAIGDKAVSIILDCIEQTRINNNRDIRCRIEHVQIVQDKDIERFKKLDVTASFQPLFLYEEALTEARVGRKRFDKVYRFKSFLEKGVNVIFNSDFPYGGGDMPEKKDGSKYIGFEPLLGIHAACYKQLNAAESVEPIEALRCYTVNAAFANYRENKSGQLKKGCFADFTVLSEDILSCQPQEMLQSEVLYTVINGEIIYARK